MSSIVGARHQLSHIHRLQPQCQYERLIRRGLPRRGYATDVPKQPQAERFSEPSRPAQYYARPNAPQRDLPSIKSRWPLVLVASALGVTAWAAFYLYATNQEKLSSSVMKQIMNMVKDDPELREVLGEAIRPEPKWYLNGDPWIEGVINVLQGHCDVSFRLKGHKGAGTLYFTSVRKAKGEPFTILRFKIIADDGTVIHIPVKEVRTK
ncbi:DUF1783-domain-containing protein [Gloeophyllum trabeum ATCC 11539]|uniref:DUF1783-domain-containing protein n=1 Tax=Gloeophyllum trabeum (strain ATCC 11539 / FP-39264 / Madison 617) TaxID=670483 RepID=S7RSX7_GLOTA|nr:DUF1783-domain-containing protein [Gloeophyllum trabeum ATCC 11539]EPQ57790.1 DUF1783-domain-containing protein [Gloeophyllum trabeum ATCC 11539]